MQDLQYIDGFQQVHFIAGMGRVDLFVLKPRPDGEPNQEVVGELVMTPQGFINALNGMQQLADKLIEAGILQTTRQG